MCSRICLSTDITAIRNRFSILGGKSVWRPHWNIGPGHVLPVIRWEPLLQRRCLNMMRWGLVPAWATNMMIVRANLNAQTIGSGPGEFVRAAPNRCLVPVDGFFEWRKRDRQPFAVAPASRDMMALAGVWDLWISPAGERVECFAIITTRANDLLSPLCERMPVIIAPQHWDQWLGKDPLEEACLRALSHPCDDAQLVVWPIDRRVSNLKNDDPAILDRVANI